MTLTSILFRNPDLFPVADISVTVKGGSVITLGSKKTQEALQYSGSAGLPSLVGWWKNWLQWWVSKSSPNSLISLEKRDVIVTCGSQDGLTKAFEMLLNPGDPIILESPTYSGSLAALRSLDLEYLEIGTDSDGLLVDQLEELLSSRSTSLKQKKPKIIYTIPNGGNPSGISTSLSRRQRVYELARQHDLLILEDDPYALLHFDYDRPIPSYLSMDTDGRVIRFDSLSKTISAGLRVGFVTCPIGPLSDKLIFHQQSSVLHASGVSQAVVMAILESMETNSSNGASALYEHGRIVSSYYKQKKDIFEELAKKHLSPLKVTWHEPVAGMFYWLNIGATPAAMKSKSDDNGAFNSKTLLREKAVDAGVLLVPGIEFVHSEKSKFAHIAANHVRASFSIATPEQLETAIIRLAKVLEGK